MLYHFLCPVCEYGDAEAGKLATESQIYCGLCATDNGVDVLLKRWPAKEGDADDHPVSQDRT